MESPLSEYDRSSTEVLDRVMRINEVKPKVRSMPGRLR